MPSGRFRRAWASAAQVLATAAALGALSGAAAGGRQASGGSRELPDGVLARIEGHRMVTLAEATRRFVQARGAPAQDSITPAGARGFLDLLVDEAVLTEEAMRRAGPPAPADSAAQAGLRDRLTLAVALDSALAETRRRAFPPGAEPDPDTLGEVARDRTVARLDPAYDDAVVALVARAFLALPRPTSDSSLAAQLRMLKAVPRLEPSDGARTIVRSSIGVILAREVIESWSHLGIAVRPRIDTEDQVRDLAANLLFERSLRARALASRLDTLAAVRAALTREAEREALAEYLERAVVSKVELDSTALESWYVSRAERFALPLRVRGLRMTFDDRAAATRMAVALRDAAGAESLGSQARRSGVDYGFEVDASSDSSLFRRALAAGTGAVVGPVAEAGVYWVARVTEIVPGRPRRLAEVRREAEWQWRAEEIERRTRMLAGTLRSTMRLERRPDADEMLSRALRRSTSSRAESAGAAP